MFNKVRIYAIEYQSVDGIDSVLILSIFGFAFSDIITLKRIEYNSIKVNDVHKNHIHSTVVQNGDEIEVDVNKGIINLLLENKQIEERIKNYQPILPDVKGGYQKMYIDHVMQADKGADLDFLVGKRGSEVKRHSH